MRKELRIETRFENYLVEIHEHFLGGNQYIFRFPNDYGASVIPEWHSENLWEVGLIWFNPDGEWELSYHGDLFKDVVRSCSDEFVNELLRMIQEGRFFQ